MTNTITLLDIIEDTVVDGPGFRVSVFGLYCNENHKQSILRRNIQWGRSAISSRRIHTIGQTTENHYIQKYLVLHGFPLRGNY